MKLTDILSLSKAGYSVGEIKELAQTIGIDDSTVQLAQQGMKPTEIATLLAIDPLTVKRPTLDNPEEPETKQPEPETKQAEPEPKPDPKDDKIKNLEAELAEIRKSNLQQDVSGTQERDFNDILIDMLDSI